LSRFQAPRLRADFQHADRTRIIQHNGADEIVPSDSVMRASPPGSDAPFELVRINLRHDATRRCSSDSLDISRLKIATDAAANRDVSSSSAPARSSPAKTRRQNQEHPKAAIPT